MSKSVTRTALVEDCFAMMLASEKICEPFKEAGRDHLHFAQFGSITRSADNFAVSLLNKFRDNWESHKKIKEEVGFRSAPLVPATQAESTLAFVLGWLCHKAVDRQLKPETEEAGFYQDAFIFRKMYCSSVVSSQDIADLFRAMQQRFLIEMHTFVPDVDNIEGWFDKLHVLYGERTAFMDRYAEAITNPEPEKVKRFVTDTDFYNDGDAIIQLALLLRKGENPSQEALRQAYEADPKSQYGRALKQGFGNLLSASVYFSGDMDSGKLEALLAV